VKAQVLEENMSIQIEFQLVNKQVETSIARLWQPKQSANAEQWLRKYITVATNMCKSRGVVGE
jgi:hypothetical protein